MNNRTIASLRRRWTKLIVCLSLSSLLVAPASLAQQPLPVLADGMYLPLIRR